MQSPLPLRKVHVGPKRLKLDEDTRWQLAGEAIDELRRYGGWKELDEEAPNLGRDRRRRQAGGVEGEARLRKRARRHLFECDAKQYRSPISL